MGKISMDLAMVAVGSVIVQQRTARKHGKDQHGRGNGGGWQYNSTTVHVRKHGKGQPWTWQ